MSKGKQATRRRLSVEAAMADIRRQAGWHRQERGLGFASDIDWRTSLAKKHAKHMHRELRRRGYQILESFTPQQAADDRRAEADEHCWLGCWRGRP